MNDKVLSLLGLATRARKMVFGEDAVLHEVAKHPNHIVFLAQDAGQNITKKILNKASTYHLTVNQTYPSDDLSKACGKRHVKVLLVTDKGFSTSIKNYMKS